jgi:hypothetical protein
MRRVEDLQCFQGMKLLCFIGWKLWLDHLGFYLESWLNKTDAKPCSSSSVIVLEATGKHIPFKSQATTASL